MRGAVYQRSYPGPIYIHYGANEFDPSKFNPIVNRPNWIKPRGHTGLWASPRNSERTWKDWAESNHYEGSDLTKSFEFRMANPGKVFYVFDAPSYEVLVGRYGIKNESGFGEYQPYFIDFEKMVSDGWDALEISISSWPMLYDLLYGWDCDSILIFNKDAIETIGGEDVNDQEKSIFDALDEGGDHLGNDIFTEWDSALHDNLFS